MNKTDPAFQWKMPIEFYGKVVDQFGEPIPDAKILFQWTTVVGKVPDPEQQSWSGTDGRFELRNVQGKTLAVKVSKPGYTRTEDWAQGFEYAAFYQENFYVADPTNPTLFHLRKEIETEPLYLFKASDRLALNDHPRILELASGKMTAYGDFSFALKTLNRPNDSSSNFFVEIGALNGSGLILTKEEFPIRAPVSGYKTFLSIDYGQKNLDDNRQLSFTFYAKTHDDHYGLVFVEASMPSNEGSTVIRTVVRYNPSGSQNLEFDHTKWINR